MARSAPALLFDGPGSGEVARKEAELRPRKEAERKDKGRRATRSTSRSCRARARRALAAPPAVALAGMQISRDFGRCAASCLGII